MINRVTDPPSSARIVMEADAANQLFRLARMGRIHWISSVGVEMELGRNPDRVTREEVLELLAYASEVSVADANTIKRARTLLGFGYGDFDGFNVALAEQAKCDVFLTTDDRLLRLARRQVGKPAVELANPVEWLTRMNLWRL